MKYLVVVDMQNDFIDGALGTPEAQAIVPKVVKKIEEFDGEIRYTQDTHYGGYLNTQEGRLLPVKHCIVGTEGWNIHPLVESALFRRGCKGGGVRGIRKETFGSANLAAQVQYDCVMDEKNGNFDLLDEIIFVGLCTDICVISNALLFKAYFPEVKITVDASCCAGVTPERHKNALEAMKACQIFIENEVTE